MGGKSGGGEAAAARKEEQERQQRIREGTARIGSIFDGKAVGSGALDTGAKFDPKGSYFLADGTKWSPTTTKPTATSTGTPTSTVRRNGDNSPRWLRDRRGEDTPVTPTNTGKTPEQQFAEMMKGGKLYSGTAKEGGFNDDYFSGVRQNFVNYATPQLEKQYGDAQKELTFALARGGNLDSSVRGAKAGDLQQLYDLNKQQVADQALAYEGEARSSVEDARNGLISTLNATGDAEGAANSAVARASALSKPAAYSPLSQLFADFTSTLGTQAALERANYYSGGQTGSRYSTGLFTPNNAVKVT